MFSAKKSSSMTRNSRWRAISAVVLAVTMFLMPTTAFGQAQILAQQAGLPDLDARTGTVTPTSTQLAIVSNLGATATWNQFGTPRSLIKYGGSLATGLSGSPAAAALSWVRTNAALFRLSNQGVDNLELLNDSPMVGTTAHAVLFRQRFGNLPAAQDGMIAVGIKDGTVYYASSSSAGDGNTPAAATLGPQAAWLQAAANLGHSLSLTSLTAGKNINGWLTFTAAGLSGLQRVRLVAMPTPTGGVRPAYETILLNVQNNGAAEAYTVFVDAVDGRVLFRQNRVQQALSAGPAPAPVTSTCDGTGHLCSYDSTMGGVAAAPTCGLPEGPFTTPANTKSIDVAATADVATNDIDLKLLDSSFNVVTNSDVGGSPEAIHYEPVGGVPAGTVFYVKICPSPNPLAPFLDPLSYHGSIVFNDVAGTQLPLTNTPKWQAFTANPPLSSIGQFPWNNPSTDTRIIMCWLDNLSNPNPSDANCQFAVKNLASRVPWDAEPHTGLSNGTTNGNNAITGEAWISPLTAGGLHQQPAHADRAYFDPWNNTWFKNKCDPTSLVPGGNDIFPAVTNLFVGHNRMHDFSYFLGFTETNYNAQLYNFGNTAPGPYPLGREGDPEEGNVQAGAITGGAPSYLGRDNANQITLNDGIPPITNQYLFQPIAGAFYSPCVDGDMDTSVFGHEYTHLISNRMVGGPDSGLSGYQAGSMGESWSDLDAVEYLHAYGFVPTGGENPFSVGAYATGNKTVGIRDYALNLNPLNYSDLGFDTPGPEVHADGEIWNAVNYDLRQALITKYDASFPASNAALQKRCADGILPADQCPGNRRWIQIVYDGWLLMQPGVSMLDARDAYLAADMMRFGGANQVELWREFARRGMGQFAFSNTTEDTDAIPSFESPAQSDEANITFETGSADGGAAPQAKIFVGRYEARAVPIADTDPVTTLGTAAKFVPGTYEFVAQAPGFGLLRFTQTFSPNQTGTVTLWIPHNWASTTNGGTASGDGVNFANLIDDTEATQWESTLAPVAGKQVTVNLGSARSLRYVQVSAMLAPGQNRFSALRNFEVWTCTASLLNANCTIGGFTKVLTSPTDAFPSLAPRPVAPDLILRTFNLASPVSATHVRVVVVGSQCTGGPAFAGEQDNDPLNSTDCATQSASAGEVRIAELQVFATREGAVCANGTCVPLP